MHWKSLLRPSMGSLTLLAVVASLLVWKDLSAASSAPPLPADPELARVAIGYRIAPVPLKQRGARLHNLIGLGSYLVNAQGGCSDCHTLHPYAEGHDPFKGQPMQINPDGYLAGGQEFGPFVSRNLTPEANGLPAGMTFESFRQVMRTGIDLDHKHPQISPLLQVMPWPLYGQMSDNDLRAIWEYLRAIPSQGTPD